MLIKYKLNNNLKISMIIKYKLNNNLKISIMLKIFKLLSPNNIIK
jgi:hypothetical protein